MSLNTETPHNSRNICASLLNTAIKYDLFGFVTNYIQCGQFPCNSAWRNIVIKTITASEESKWKVTLSLKEDMKRYAKVHTKLRMHYLYDLMYEYPNCRSDLQLVINVTSRSKTSRECINCHTQCFDHDCHVILHCEHYMHQRNTFYSTLIDELDIELYVQIEMLDDDDDIISLFSGAHVVPDMSETTRKSIILHFAMYLSKLKHSLVYLF